MNSNDQWILTNYMSDGGLVYMEGSNITQDHEDTMMIGMFGANHGSNGTAGEILQLLGEPATFADQASFIYAGGNDPHYEPDEMILAGGSCYLKSEDDKIRGIFNIGYNYRTICTSTIIGAYANGSGLNLREYLMGQYIDFLRGTITAVDEPMLTPGVTAELYQNYPNPFHRSGAGRNAVTTISYSLAASGKICLSVYNIKGEKVRTLVDKLEEKGRHEITWNGLNDSGCPLQSGMYLYRLQADGKDIVRKLLLLK